MLYFVTFYYDPSRRFPCIANPEASHCLAGGAKVRRSLARRQFRCAAVFVACALWLWPSVGETQAENGGRGGRDAASGVEGSVGGGFSFAYRLHIKTKVFAHTYSKNLFEYT